MVVEIKFLKIEIKEMETHMEDDDAVWFWQEKMTHKYVTMAELWRRMCTIQGESTYRCTMHYYPVIFG